MSTSLPERISVRIGPAQFSGPVVGPEDAYLRDCWTAVIGPAQVLAYRRLHQLVGAEVPTLALSQSLGLGKARLAGGLARLEHYGGLKLEDNLCQLSPGLRYLTPSELDRAGPIVEGLHAAHLRARGLEPHRIARLAWEGSRSLRTPARTKSVPALSMAE
ncbi:MAG: hypothetical protein ACYCS2_04805 [Acidimicrobiales bacterium]